MYTPMSVAIEVTLCACITTEMVKLDLYNSEQMSKSLSL